MSTVEIAVGTRFITLDDRCWIKINPTTYEMRSPWPPNPDESMMMDATVFEKSNLQYAVTTMVVAKSEPIVGLRPDPVQHATGQWKEVTTDDDREQRQRRWGWVWSDT